MNKRTKIFFTLFIFVFVGFSLFSIYYTNSEINTMVENSIPTYIPKCDKIPTFKGDLKQCNFENANLNRVNLSGFDLTNANFKGANLMGANLNGVDLQAVSFQGADLSGADLEYAYLYKANLTRANLTGANFYHAHLAGVDLTNAITTHTNFTNAIFHVDGLD